VGQRTIVLLRALPPTRIVRLDVVMPSLQIKLFVFPRMFGILNLSPFCCKLETWLRIAKIPYTVVETNSEARFLPAHAVA